jgi:catechol 2,3-dioxygenase-like lactoylglutathione lyase family enzyme
LSGLLIRYLSVFRNKKNLQLFNNETQNLRRIVDETIITKKLMERRSFIRNIGLGLTGTIVGRQAFAINGNKLIIPKMETITHVVNKFMMLSLNVSDMPKARAFYADKLGLKITTDYRIDDNNWWVSLIASEGGVTITLARASASPENIKPGTMALYFETSDIAAAHKELTGDGLQVNDIQNDLFGPGSGVKFFNLKDPDGNLVHLVQAHESSVPF